MPDIIKCVSSRFAGLKTRNKVIPRLSAVIMLSAAACSDFGYVARYRNPATVTSVPWAEVSERAKIILEMESEESGARRL